MEQRRILSFAVLSMMIFVGWYAFVVPRFLPPPPDEDPQAVEEEPLAEEDADDVREPAVVAEGEGDEPATVDPGAEGERPADPGNEVAQEPVVPQHPERSLVLGSLDPQSRYFVEVRLTSRGAAVASIALNDPRYRELTETDSPLKVVGNPFSAARVRRELNGARGIDGLKSVRIQNTAPEPAEDRFRHELASGGFVVLDFDHPLNPDESTRVESTLLGILEKQPRTFALAMPQLDEALEDAGAENGLTELNWRVVDEKRDEDGHVHDVTFAFESPDGTYTVRKRYWLERLSAETDLEIARRTEAIGYTLRFAVSIENATDEPVSVDYALQGPVGVPLEDPDNTRKYRDIKAVFYSDGEPTDSRTVAASTVVSKVDEKAIEQWTNPVRYIGVDVQYFAALVFPGGDQVENSYLKSSHAELVERNTQTQLSDVSVGLVSRTIDVAAGSTVTHAYDLFAGPKKREVLASIDAGGIVDYGWFPFGRSLTRFISNGLLTVLTFLHQIGLPYGLAIVGLTVLVRAAMFPISLKQNRNMTKMRELQPKIKELQAKYANDREKMGQAMMALYREHNYNPLAGCLPMFLQLPIFIGLYQALGNAVELRMASFLWIKNLAAPDALFELPFSLPFLGSSFNLLPILTIGLFIVQQRMFMPPPTDEQQAMQMKMMTYMMVFMGFLFYRVPAGLCVYFIASSGWGIAERKLLGKIEPQKTPPAEEEDRKTVTTTARRTDGDGEPKKDGFLGRLLKQADAAANPTASTGGNGASKSRKDKGGRGKRRKARK